MGGCLDKAPGHPTVDSRENLGSLTSKRASASDLQYSPKSEQKTSELQQLESTPPRLGNGDKSKTNDIALDQPLPVIKAPLSKSEEASSGAFYALRKTQDFFKKYSNVRQIGQGQYGLVFQAVEEQTKQQYAIKTVSKTNISSKTTFTTMMTNEVEILYHLGGHEHIVQLFEVFEDDHAVHLVMELCSGGSWFESLLKDGLYTESDAAIMVEQLLRTLLHCHSLGVVHRDIKPENLLCTEEGSLKLADFGLAVLSPETALESPATKSQHLKDAVGTPFYVAPEIPQGHQYGKECDIWSVGVVLYLVLSGRAPFDGKNKNEILKSVVRSQLSFSDPTWEEISEEAKDFISLILVKDPKKRATIPDLLQHPFIISRQDRPSHPVPDAVVSRLQKFSHLNIFKREARKVLAKLLPVEEVSGLGKIFKEMDINGLGVLGLSEFRAALFSKGINLPESKALEMLTAADLNHDGVIDYEEFLAATVHEIRFQNSDLLSKAFSHFDLDQSGAISRDELKASLSYHGSNVTSVDLDAIMDDVDQDHDGMISLKEFKESLCSVGGGRPGSSVGGGMSIRSCLIGSDVDVAELSNQASSSGQGMDCGSANAFSNQDSCEDKSVDHEAAGKLPRIYKSECQGSLGAHSTTSTKSAASSNSRHVIIGPVEVHEGQGQPSSYWSLPNLIEGCPEASDAAGNAVREDGRGLVSGAKTGTSSIASRFSLQDLMMEVEPDIDSAQANQRAVGALDASPVRCTSSSSSRRNSTGHALTSALRSSTKGRRASIATVIFEDS